MQAPASRNALGLARTRARRWLRVFQQLVRVLDRLEAQESSLLATSLVFLVQRALGHLEKLEPVSPVRQPMARDDEEEVECSGDELLAAVDLTRPVRDARDRRDLRNLRDDPANDELEVLLVLSGALTEAPDDDPSGEGTFGDLSLPVEALVREYRALKQLSAQDVMAVTLFPTAFRRRWSALLASAAAREDPLRRLALELSVMKVIHALYSMAVGYRRADNEDRPEADSDAWFAFTVGEAALKAHR